MYNLLKQELGNAVLMIFLLVAVLVTNSLVITIWLNPKHRTSVSVLLSIIAIYDTLTIICGASTVVTSFAAGKLLATGGCYVVIVCSVFAFVFHSLSIASTTFLAIQRATVCAFPFSGPRLCGFKATTIFTVISFVAIVSLKIPDLLFYDIDGLVQTEDDNSSALYCRVNYILDDESISRLPMIYMWIRFFALHLTPACIITFCMIVCLAAINRKKIGVGQSSDQKSKTRTTIMLVLIMTIFVLGEFPTTISVFFRAFLPTQPIWLKTSTGNWFCNVVLVISYILNIWVYIAMSKQFRESLMEFFCKCRIWQVDNTTDESGSTKISKISRNMS